MAYKALYNKYRPTTFDEVAGQHSVVRTLRNAIENNKIAHAYLFCGPRGTGKTSMARLFAKALNCEEGPGHQCNHCSNCLAMNAGSHPDVIEIDAASNSGVEQVRDLIDKVRYAPIKGKYKIYIIDEVHTMSANAFNALLKTIEEPPENVIFILATTEPFKVLATILSRCQRYDFSKIDDKEIRDKLVWILQREGVPFEEPALEAIIELADGGMRDALSILDQALAYGGNQLHAKDVLDVFGLTSIAQKCKLLGLVASGQVSSVLSLADEFITSGIDIKRLIQALLDILKDCLIYLKTGKEELLQHAKVKDIDPLIAVINAARANEMIDILIRCQTDSKTVGNLRSLFELALIRMTSLFSGANEEVPVIVKPAPAPSVPEPKPEPVVAPKPEPVIESKLEPQPVVSESTSVEKTSAPEPKEEGVYSGTTAPSWLFDKEDEPEEEEEIPVEPIAPIKEATFTAPKPQPAPEPVVETKPEPKEPAPEVKPAPKPIFPPEPEPAPEPVKKEKPAPIFPLEEEKRPGTVAANKPGNIATEGESYSLDDQTIVQIMVLGGKYKKLRQALYERWGEIGEYRFDPKLGAIASLLSEGRPFCLCEDALLLNFNFSRKKELANLKANQDAIADLVGTLLGRKVFIYGLDRNDSNRCQNTFFSLKQIDKLPKPEDIVLNLPIRRK